MPTARAAPAGAAWALAALLCAGAGLALAAQHPLAPLGAPLAFMLFAAACALWPGVWLVSIPALLPVLGLAPWSGWITFEEWDLLVLAAAAAGYARLASLALRGAPSAADVVPGGMSPVAMLFVVALTASQWVAMARGFADAGGFSFGLTQGYREPMNSLRLAKSLCAALLLFVLWDRAHRADPQRTTRRLQIGLVVGLLGACLAALWERLAYTDLLNFSTDYRTTALFWEMHVGGAAFDGFLALSVPFAARELLLAPTRRRWLALVGITLIAAYACLTTFSRGVYLAVPMGLVIMAAVQARQSGANSGMSLRGLVLPALPAVAMVAAFAVAAALIFPTSGYRGMLALLGVMVVLLQLPLALQGASRALWLQGALGGALLSAIVWACTGLLAKGAYIGYAVAAGLTLAALPWQRPGAATKPLALAGFVAMLTGLALVALHWGGEPALAAAWPVILGLLVVFGVAAVPAAPRWPPGLRWQGMTVGAMVLAGSVVAAFGGGAYMTVRFATSSSDLDGRILHWRQGLTMLRTPADTLLGRGLGRFVDNYALGAPIGQRIGDYRLRSDDSGNRWLTLVAGTHELGFGELLRISQRVEVPQGPAYVRLDVRTDKPLVLHFDVCQKHLLYVGDCLLKELRLPAKPGAWQTVQARLDRDPLSRGDWYAPKLVMFSLASESTHLADIDNVKLIGVDGRNLLANGDFSAGLERWFFTSDRYHLPWHVKNIVMHVLLDQGLVGLALMSVLFGAAFLRVTVGPGRLHPLAPGIAGALAGFLVVGMFDSLLDVPRVAFLFYFLLLLALTLRTSRVWPKHP